MGNNVTRSLSKFVRLITQIKPKRTFMTRKLTTIRVFAKELSMNYKESAEKATRDIHEICGIEAIN